MTDKKNPAISVIIAMYNSEEYITDCLDSLIIQTFQDFEVIIADDCSTDNSYKVAQGFISKFGDRLKLIKLPRNSGFPGIPRNFAFKKARGKYIYFLDSDDLLEKTTFEKLYETAEEFNADVVHAETSIAFRENGNNLEWSYLKFQTVTPVEKPTIETFDVGERLDGLITKKFLWWACNKLFNRKFLRDNDIVFAKTKQFEDFLFIMQCLVFAKNYVRVPYVGYYYRVREGSLSHGGLSEYAPFQNLVLIMKAIDDFMNRTKFFIDNPRYKYSIIDFFMKGRMDSFEESFIAEDYNLGEVYNSFRALFSRTPQENLSLTTYLFIAANLFNIRIKQQAKEIEELKSIINNK
ncbi:MAG: glycosyltransferase [Selenomonadaceae bacterium]|nr:glycosyltransferase [Selenomonadaceae bacterium]